MRFLFSEARVLASNRRCKYTEVSAILEHKVDELLVGIIRQIRLNQTNPLQHRAEADEMEQTGCLHRVALGVMHRLCGTHREGSQEHCDLLAP